MQQLRKNLPFKMEEYHHHIESMFKVRLRSLEVGEIIYYKVNVGRERSGILLGLLDSGLGDIDESDFPALLRQPDRVPTGPASQIQCSAAVRKDRQNVFRKGLCQKRIGRHWA